MKYISSLLTSCILLPVFSALGSGDYSPPPRNTDHSSNSSMSRSSATNKNIDGTRFNLGKDIYLGKIDLPADPINEANYETQNKILSRMKITLPKSVVKKLDAADLAGRLTKEQFDSFRYFLIKRFK